MGFRYRANKGGEEEGGLFAKSQKDEEGKGRVLLPDQIREDCIVEGHVSNLPIQVRVLI